MKRSHINFLIFISWITLSSFCFISESAAQNQILKIHTDQQLYFCGDTVWLKALVLKENKISDDINIKLAQVLLVNTNKKIEKNIKIIIKEGQGNCYFMLDSLMKTGVYTLYSFIPTMHNFTVKAIATPIFVSRLETLSDSKQFDGNNDSVYTSLNQTYQGFQKQNTINLEFKKNTSNQYQIISKDKLNTAIQAQFSVSIQHILTHKSIGLANDTLIDLLIHQNTANAYKGLSIKGIVKFPKEVPAELNEIILSDTSAYGFSTFQFFGNSNPNFTISNLNLFGKSEFNLEIQKNYQQNLSLELMKDSFDFPFVFQQVSISKMKELIFFTKKLKNYSKNHNQREQVFLPPTHQFNLPTNQL
jgi:hypothetical protein